jgi:hypothetical protein
VQEGQGRAHVKGLPTGPRLADPSEPLVFPRNSIAFPDRTRTRAPVVTISHTSAAAVTVRRKSLSLGSALTSPASIITT